MFLFIPILCGVNSRDTNYIPKKKKDQEVLSAGEYQGLYCPHCHNYSVSPIKNRKVFELYFIPLIPFKAHKQLHCSICNWRQNVNSDYELNTIVKSQKNIKMG
ncbi:hypothetical protein TBLA_0I02190 [Henningerozyma blattae CBS 6284]|uniref:Uncharacterized protein n=1 Tax=Henningerozyma blattae (strain ATCC 34711 / CBS 6284 / DSM 70876 / NBRC 10599 / NRRL Y-10934 / UCD 77-7) TaxID=1071380 RepID=I2H925_HENB6|nr:hypothetical protein TBLA_0I02190 [Tetrapisispora blattae CBS 6284]CCH62877.1 hypothetical protein TBLA_0I02190 [Tetrapisispora blattae CBS 6284]